MTARGAPVTPSSSASGTTASASRPIAAAGIFELFAQVERTLDRMRRAGSASASRWCASWWSCTAAAISGASDGVGPGQRVRRAVCRCSSQRARCDRGALRRAATQRPAQRRYAHPARRRQRDALDNARHAAPSATAIRVHAAGDGARSARGGRASAGPIVVLLDIGMPQLDGYYARQQDAQPGSGRKNTLLIAVTGRGAKAAGASQVGFDACTW